MAADIARLQANLPPDGELPFITVTDKQFERIRVLAVGTAQTARGRAKFAVRRKSELVCRIPHLAIRKHSGGRLCRTPLATAIRPARPR